MGPCPPPDGGGRRGQGPIRAGFAPGLGYVADLFCLYGGFVCPYFQEEVKMSADRLMQVIFDRELCRNRRFWAADLKGGRASRRVGDGWGTTGKISL